LGKHKTTVLERARDELMSHVIRCDVFDAEMGHRTEWLDETIDYMAERYPQLTEIQVAKLEIMGKQFIKPAIPHGRGHSARTRDENLSEMVKAEIGETVTEPTAGPVEPAADERQAA
jgi:hypothetical protein